MRGLIVNRNTVMPKLEFDEYIFCFRKQFLFQKGHGGHRISQYYTNYNQQQRLKNDQWAIIVFIYCGEKYGFEDIEMRKELKISPSLYEVLKEEIPEILSSSYPDELLHKKVTSKIKLVKNSILNTYFIKM